MRPQNIKTELLSFVLFIFSKMASVMYHLNWIFISQCFGQNYNPRGFCYLFAGDALLISFDVLKRSTKWAGYPVFSEGLECKFGQCFQMKINQKLTVIGLYLFAPFSFYVA